METIHYISSDLLSIELIEKIVVEDITERLSFLGDVKIGETKALKLSTFYHLKTPILVESKQEISFEKAVKILHPTSALGAYPKMEGEKWLEENESDRNFFGAPFGLVYKGQAKCLVAIRQVEYTPKNFSLIAGCGILKESDQELEWQEWKLKIASIQKLCGLKTEF